LHPVGIGNDCYFAPAVCCSHLKRVLQPTDLRGNNAPRFRFGARDENVVRFG
jgi:hypothetical protein